MGTLNLGNDGTINGVVKKPSHPYLLCQSSTGQVVNNNTNTILTSLFGNTRISQGGLSYNTSNGRITIPVAGLYRVRARVTDSNEGRWGNDHHFDVYLNGSAYQHVQLYYMPTGNWGNIWYCPSHVDIVVNCTNASDYIQFNFFQNSGSNQTLHSEFCSFEVYLIG